MLHRLACSVLALSLLGGVAAAKPYRFEDDLAGPVPVSVQPEFAKPVAIKPNPATVELDRAKVKTALAARRAANLGRFRAYRNAGVFPHNFVQDGALNVWLDAEGRLCAAATMISMSGLTDQVMQQAGDDNFVRLADVADGWLLDWILTSGLTQNEIVMIQEPFMGRMEPIDLQLPDDQRLAEDRRLRKRYAQVDRRIVRNRKASLDRAVDRLMANPALARMLLAAS